LGIARPQTGFMFVGSPGIDPGKSAGRPKSTMYNRQDVWAAKIGRRDP
jgi:hypothetical protein